MATVTMSGKEYQDLLKAQEQRDEVLQWMVSRTAREFTEESFKTWGAGEPVEDIEMPKWLYQAAMCEMARIIMSQAAPIIDRLVESSICRYTPLTRELNSFSGEDVRPYFPGLEQLWANVKAARDLGIVRKEDE